MIAELVIIIKLIKKLVLPAIPDIKGKRVVPRLGAAVEAADADTALLKVLAATVAAVILENVFVISDGELYINIRNIYSIDS